MTVIINGTTGIDKVQDGSITSADLASGAALANIGANGVTAGYLDTQSQYTGFKNRIINGAMMIDQRNAGAATSSSLSGYCVDRWQLSQSTTGKLIAQQNAGSVTLPTGFTYYLGATSQSAYTVGSSDQYGFLQWIEGYNIADIGFGTANAKPVTLSFWVRSSLTGTFGGALQGYNGSTFRSYPFTYTISSANTWTQVSISVPADTTSFAYNTTNGYGLCVILSMGAGSSNLATAGSWTSGAYSGATGQTSVVGTNGATFYITGVQLEKGSTATSFDYRPYGTELSLCQRYFFGLGNKGSNQGYVFPQPGNAPSGGGGMPIIFTLPVTMRTQPDINYNISAGNYTSGDPSGTQWRLVAPNIDGCTFSGTTVSLFGISSPTAAGIQTLYANISRQPAIITFGSTAYLNFSAEL